MEQKSIISEQTRKELDKNTVDFYLSEAEKQLDGVVDVSNRITERAYILLTGIITVLTGFGWILNMQEGNISLVLISIIGILASIVVLGILILKIICIHTVWLPGKKPSELDIDIFIDYYCSCKIRGDKRYVNIVADHLEAIENKIALNLEDIRVRTTWYGRCLKICFFTICIIVLILVAEHFTCTIGLNSTARSDLRFDRFT